MQERERELAKLLAGSDQGWKLLCDILPSALGSYKKALEEHGFSSQEAMMLCLAMQQQYMGRIYKPASPPESAG